MPLKEDFPKDGLVRLTQILAPRGPIPVSKTTWWAGVKTGRFPLAVKITPRITAWRAEDINRLIADFGYSKQHSSSGPADLVSAKTGEE